MVCNFLPMLLPGACWCLVCMVVLPMSRKCFIFESRNFAWYFYPQNLF
uniref:Uncharacterized protein n=1 Tax=Setaria viridis TaxID=4556 RepID=A0A4U6W8C3_SETVI|nr:hypothetical protein SEVIR_1G081033v2 [Setaria viridis]